MNEETDTAAAESLVSLMDRLIEPPVPPPIPLTPETAGWWLLGALVLTGLAYGAWRLWLYRRANAYRRAALAELSAAGDDPAAIAAVLRRAALAAFPRETVASATGEAWLAFLRSTGGFPAQAGPALLGAPYAPPRAGGEAALLRKAADRWIRTHRRAP
ncbi:MAG: DUF4381 domain-containing protein [Pseudomonadota bacterium]